MRTTPNCRTRVCVVMTITRALRTDASISPCSGKQTGSRQKRTKRYNHREPPSHQDKPGQLRPSPSGVSPLHPKVSPTEARAQGDRLEAKSITRLRVRMAPGESSPGWTKHLCLRAYPQPGTSAGPQIAGVVKLKNRKMGISHLNIIAKGQRARALRLWPWAF